MWWDLARCGEFAALGYLAGWRLVAGLPDRVARGLFDLGADLASYHGVGPDQLRRNLARVVGPEHVTRDLVRRSMRSYARYWLEAFRLPQLARGDWAERLDVQVDGVQHFDRSYATGRGVVIALPHAGNWDLAGMWLARRIGRFTTVAERLQPEELFQAFVAYRESLGFDVLAHAGGATRPYDRCREVLSRGGVVVLMGERDLKGRGVPVEFFGEPTTFPAGPAKLAQETGAALHAAHCWFTETPTGPRGRRRWGWGMACSPEIRPGVGPDSVRETTQLVATYFARGIAEHPEDWHMLQPQWLADREAER